MRPAGETICSDFESARLVCRSLLTAGEHSAPAADHLALQYVNGAGAKYFEVRDPDFFFDVDAVREAIDAAEFGHQVHRLGRW